MSIHAGPLRWQLLAAVCATALPLLLAADAPRASAEDQAEVVVTSVIDGPEGACPSETLCTLRRAIEVANADLSERPFTITFDPSVFRAGAEIPIGSTPLPTITRDNLLLSASGADVTIVSTSLSLTETANGLTVEGSEVTISGLALRGFSGTCIRISGTDAVIGGIEGAMGNSFIDCATGIEVAGEGARVQANRFTRTQEQPVSPDTANLRVLAGDALIGGPPVDPEVTNYFGAAATGVVVGGPAVPAFTGTVIQRNVFGKDAEGEFAALQTGVRLLSPSSATAVRTNVFANVQTGIAVGASAADAAVRENTFESNTFQSVTGLPIDLASNDMREPNDPGDTDDGPNQLLNHPVIARAAQSSVTGTACAFCRVELYLADHLPGEDADYGTAPIGEATASDTGQFSFLNPAAGLGEWVIALATDSAGNTSEFGKSARVGAGAVLCGNVQLNPGWNHVGYFGAEPVALLTTLPIDPSGSITAIYRVIDGSGDFERWFKETTIGRTLATLQPGESYWFYTTAPVTLPGGFSISFPVPVNLRAGWNDLLYLGGSAPVADALGSLPAGFEELYHYDSASARWLRFGGPETPSWAQEFQTLEACSVYQVRLAAPATLIPLQP